MIIAIVEMISCPFSVSFILKVDVFGGLVFASFGNFVVTGSWNERQHFFMAVGEARRVLLLLSCALDFTPESIRD